MERGELRHALYRKKNGIPREDASQLYALIEPMIPPGESWDTFSLGWDILLVGGDIIIISPEVDYDFIHSTCLEISMYAKTRQSLPELTNRQRNVITIVEANMLDGKMKWETYNKEWGISVIKELRRINTRMFKTNINIVTDKMISNSVISEGAAMISLPTIPEIELTPPVPISSKEAAKIIRNG